MGKGTLGEPLLGKGVLGKGTLGEPLLGKGVLGKGTLGEPLLGKGRVAGIGERCTCFLALLALTVMHLHQ